MRYVIFFSIMLLSIFGNLSAQSTSPIREISIDMQNKIMPEFILKDINSNSKLFGKNVSLKDFKGHPLLVYFGSVG